MRSRQTTKTMKTLSKKELINEYFIDYTRGLFTTVMRLVLLELNDRGFKMTHKSLVKEHPEYLL